MSVISPSVIDFDYIGNTSNYDHIIRNTSQTKDTIQFDMNLRTYKNTTNFTTHEPWQYPTIKAFSPNNQFKQVNELMRDKNKDH